jgi:uncharacterized protein YuzE
MKVKYSKETDTLYVTFSDSNIANSRDLDESTVLELDGEGNVCAINFEYASQRADVHRLRTLLQFKDVHVDTQSSSGF